MHDAALALSENPFDFRAYPVLYPPILFRDNSRSLLFLLRSLSPFDARFVDQKRVVQNVEVVIQDAHDITLK